MWQLHNCTFCDQFLPVFAAAFYLANQLNRLAVEELLFLLFFRVAIIRLVCKTENFIELNLKFVVVTAGFEDHIADLIRSPDGFVLLGDGRRFNFGFGRSLTVLQRSLV